MKYKFFLNSESAWSAMLSEIEKARESIYIEMFIFYDDMWDTYDFAGEILKKAQSGVKVKLVIDAHGSRIKKETLKKLQTAGAEVLMYSKWRRRIHKKIVLIDEWVGFLGGVNIKKEFRLWNDLQIRLEGRNIILGLLRSFAHTYKISGGKDEAILKYNRQETVIKKTKHWIWNHVPEGSFFSFRRHIKKLFDGAQKEILIVTPYFYPPRWMIGVLDTALERGVVVKILIPEKINNSLGQRMNRIYATRLEKIGMQVFLFPEMNHAKTILVDREKGLVGSHNFDLISGINYEVGFSFENKRAVKELEKIMSDWFFVSKSFNGKNLRKTWKDYVLIAIMDILRPFL